MPLPDYFPIPNPPPQEFSIRIAFEAYVYDKYPEYVNAEKREARRKAALELYKHFGPKPVTVTVTEREFKTEPWEIVFEIRAALE